MSEFVYLYRRQSMPGGSPQQMQERLQRWRAWFGVLEKNGHIVNHGQPLAMTGGGVVRDDQGAMNDGPYAETKDIVIGYTLIQAESLEQAVKLTAGWPGFGDGGLIEVRPIMKL